MFLVNENVGLVVPDWLRSQGHEVFSVYESARGIDDDEVIRKAFDENWILITSDKDLGDVENHQLRYLNLMTPVDKSEFVRP